MERIRARGFDSALKQKVYDERIPYIGICIGYQILFDESEEAPGVKGLGWLRGRVVRFKGGLKVPHMGWNEVRPVKSDAALQPGQFFYFVHSYYPVPEDPSIVAATCDYGVDFACAVRAKNIFAVQFHPEKSHESGRALLKNLIGG